MNIKGQELLHHDPPCLDLKTLQMHQFFLDLQELVAVWSFLDFTMGANQIYQGILQIGRNIN